MNDSDSFFIARERDPFLAELRVALQRSADRMRLDLADVVRSGRIEFQVELTGSRGAEWERIAGTRVFPVRSPETLTAELPGIDGPAQVFLVDDEALPAGQLERIVAHLSAKFGLSAEEAAVELRTVGLPILAVDAVLGVRR